MMRKYLFYMPVLIVFACTNKIAVQNEKFGKAVRAIAPSEALNYGRVYLVIPNAGCAGCISNAEAFVMKNLDKLQGLKVIFTNFQSKKMLRLKLGNAVFSHPRVLLDQNNEFYRFGLSSVYPVVYYLDRGSVIRIEEISPNNKRDVFAELQKTLIQ